MSESGNHQTVEEQIAALIALTTANAVKLQSLEAENAAIRTTNDELRALIDDVVPDSETMGHPIPNPNLEQEVDRTAPATPIGQVTLGANLDVGRNQQTPPTARVEIDLNDLPNRNDGEQDPNAGSRPDNVLKTPMSIQSTPELVKPVFNLPASINIEFSRSFEEMETLIQRIPGVPAPIKRSTANSFADSP